LCLGLHPEACTSPSVSINVQVDGHQPDVSKIHGVVRALFKQRDAYWTERKEEEDEMEQDCSASDCSSYEPSDNPSDDSEEDQESDTPVNNNEYNPMDCEDGGADMNTTPGFAAGNATDGDYHTSEDENQEEPVKKKRKKVRVRQPTSSTRRERQRAGNSGEAYINSSGKEKAAKVAVPLPDCRKKCNLKLTPETCSELCKDYWGLGKVSLQSCYLTNLLEVTEKSTQRLRLVSPNRRKNRKITVNYRVVVKGANVPVCKGCFMKCFAVSSKFIERLIRLKMMKTAGTVPRGKTGKPVDEERLEKVMEHLNSFPRYKSHYARNKTDKNFLHSGLTITFMYDDYKEKNPIQPVSRWIYEREFHSLNLCIKPIKIDTCKTCDKLETAVTYATTTETKTAAKYEQELHHRKAEKARNQKTEDIKQLSDETKRVIVFDLQQCLPTPYLQTSIVFYLRQLWVYNLTIHDCGSGRSVHNMWHEGEAERGANEIGSALFKYLLDLPNEVSEVTLWSDTCGGQNKNSVINATLQTVLAQKATLKIINQKFLVSGHTFLDCDTDHSVIERKKKNAQNIHLPRDWYNLVRNASKKFTVQLMDGYQFDFKALSKGRDSPFVKRKKNKAGDRFLWKDVVWLQHNRLLPQGTIAYKETHDKDVPFQYLDTKRKKKGTLNLTLSPSYYGPRAIPQLKKNDLLKMLHLIDPECRSFYTSLQGDKEEDHDDYDPDIAPSTDEEESEEE